MGPHSLHRDSSRQGVVHETTDLNAENGGAGGYRT